MIKARNYRDSGEKKVQKEVALEEFKGNAVAAEITRRRVCRGLILAEVRASPFL